MAGRPEFGSREHSREKALRSIFIANIAFETTEEQLRLVLSEVGTVINLKMIYDPGTGKPRGFGFCEYKDVQTANSAIRNIAGRELNGRPLRIDSAANAPGGEGNKGPSPPVPGGPAEVRSHGPAVPPENAPEVITKAVASLPPEQMFELMKQMKWFISHNPNEARQLLFHNPQLAYALLQAQVVMKVVDLETAQNLLHRTPRGPPLSPSVSHSAPPHHGPTDLHGPPPPHRGPPEPHGPPQRHGPIDHHGPPPPDHRRPPLDNRGPPPRHPYPPRQQYSGPPPPRPRMPMGRPPISQGPPVRQPRMPGPPPPVQDDQDQQKAALIMQVLSLTDEQIQALPVDQRQSIIKLKEQIRP